MPKLTRDLIQGIKLTMNFREHNPPHFHTAYGEHEVALRFDGSIEAGSLPQAKLKIVMEWASLNQAALAARWELASSGRNFTTID